MTDRMRVERRIVVACDQERAFALWTSMIGAWWPLASHSFGGARAVDVQIEPCVGGRITERWDDGTVRLWGTVTVWAPPERIVHTWHLGVDSQEATEVEVRFVTLDGDRTQVLVTQTGFERFGDAGPARREGNERGWQAVMAAYAAQFADGDRGPSTGG